MRNLQNTYVFCVIIFQSHFSMSTLTTFPPLSFLSLYVYFSTKKTDFIFYVLSIISFSLFSKFALQMFVILLVFWLFTFLINVFEITHAQEWNAELKYSLGKKDFSPFGNVLIKKQIDGNYTGEFIASGSADELLTLLTNAAANPTDTDYEIRIDNTFSLNSLMAFSQSNFAHSIELTIDQFSRKVLSITHYPSPTKNANGKLRVNLRIKQIKEISGPETTLYLHRIEEEKRARQHGASQDNRSFLQKYWMYFVPIILFMVLSNAINTDNQGQE